MGTCPAGEGSLQSLTEQMGTQPCEGVAGKLTEMAVGGQVCVGEAKESMMLWALLSCSCPGLRGSFGRGQCL